MTVVVERKREVNMITVSKPIAAGPDRIDASKADIDKYIEAGNSGELRTPWRCHRNNLETRAGELNIVAKLNCMSA